MAAQQKHYPKDAQVIISIMKDMGITEYEPKVIAQLLEFTYRYVTGILDDSRVFANHAKKKTIDLEDVRLAVEMTTDRIFTTPPPRDILLDVARSKNNTPLPFVKPHCGLRLPPDRYCLSACNYRLKNDLKKPPNKQAVNIGSSLSNASNFLSNSVTTSVAGSGNLKLPGKQGQGLSIVKRPTTLATVSRTQAITGPKPVIKFSSAPTSAPSSAPTQMQKTIVKPKIQISSAPTPSVSAASPSSSPAPNISMRMDSEDSLGGANKRKREDDEEDYDLVE
ncbi:Transcription initiation factor TFIID subunit 9 [Gryllus bimaculatus]|nr:Transcription initiation factor TFIID subunit 9 [Gryllus bimaculatus]